MKKTFGLLAIFGVLLFAASCSKKDKTSATKSPTKKSTADIAPNQWGQYHNICLDLTKPVWNQSPTPNANTLFEAGATDMGQQYPDFVLTAQQVTAMETDPNFIGLVKNCHLKGSDATNYFRGVLSTALGNQLISQDLYNIYYNMFDASLSYAQVEAIISSTDISGLSQADQDNFNAVTSIYTASSAYWTNYMNDPDHGKMYGPVGAFWDCVAGVLFFEAGPAGIVGAYVVSASCGDR
jgi:hypothetical protein